MKTTIDIPDDVYRKVKAKSALEGRTVREVAITLFGSWVETPESREAIREATSPEAAPSWFGCLRQQIRSDRGPDDMDSIRRSIARGRSRDGRAL